jgi:16S rRNA (cytidine1402-2'-O)-methyltransferase
MKRQKTFENDNPKLYLVATPIGNLEDITLRALNTLKMVDIIYCEDTRTSLKLLSHYEIKAPLHSYHLFNEKEISEKIMNNIKKGMNVAIISDAGMPVISDPGWIAVTDAIKEEIEVVIIPGVSAGITALVGSGLNSYKYYFGGFLNSKKAKREKELEKLSSKEETIVIYESPHRIEETLKIIDKIYKDRQIVIARELTKKHEEYLRGTAKEMLEVVETIKGEMVVMISGCEEKIDKDLSALTIEEHYQYYLDLDLNSKEALKQVAVDRNVSKKDIYDVLFKQK